MQHRNQLRLIQLIKFKGITAVLWQKIQPVNFEKICCQSGAKIKLTKIVSLLQKFEYNFFVIHLEVKLFNRNSRAYTSLHTIGNF